MSTLEIKEENKKTTNVTYICDTSVIYNHIYYIYNYIYDIYDVTYKSV